MLKSKKIYILKKTPLKKGNSQLKRGAIKKKPKSQIEINQEKEERIKMWNFFLEIWKERKHYSEISGKYLGEEPLTLYFEHLMEKSLFPEFKYAKWNIALVTGDEHSMKTGGFPLPKHQELIDKAESIAYSIKETWH